MCVGGGCILCRVPGGLRDFVAADAPLAERNALDPVALWSAAAAAAGARGGILTFCASRLHAHTHAGRNTRACAC